MCSALKEVLGPSKGTPLERYSLLRKRTVVEREPVCTSLSHPMGEGWGEGRGLPVAVARAPKAIILRSSMRSEH